MLLKFHSIFDFIYMSSYYILYYIFKYIRKKSLIFLNESILLLYSLIIYVLYIYIHDKRHHSLAFTFDPAYLPLLAISGSCSFQATVSGVSNFKINAQ